MKNSVREHVITLVALGSAGVLAVGGVVLSEMTGSEAITVVAATGFGVLLGVPLAVELFLADQRAQDERREQELDEEVARLRDAGVREADRVRAMAEKIVALVTGGTPSDNLIEKIVPYWTELLGSRYFQLTANDDPLHDLRHAFQLLDEAVERWKAGVAAGTQIADQIQARNSADAAIAWARTACRDFGIEGAD